MPSTGATFAIAVVFVVLLSAMILALRKLTREAAIEDAEATLEREFRSMDEKHTDAQRERSPR